ncbi:MAG: hypothetical protein N3B14_08205, partial [Thermoleophilia bacterium]|nr:hypothetical protein [Thermoleophilia bacterium]
MGEGLAGKALRTLVAVARASRFAGGRWAQVIGAGVFGLCASLAVRLAAASGGQPHPHSGLADSASRTWQGDVSALALLAVAGLLAAIAGPRLLPVWRRNSETYPEAQSRPRAHREVLGRAQVLRVLPVWGAATLATVAGVLLGQIADTTALYVVAGFLALGAAVLVLARPAVVLVAVAAFPWLDWIARK